MHVVLAAHPAAAPPLALLAGVLDHGYSTKELRRQTMDDVLRQIDEGFRLARELMEELPAAQNEPTYLADRCHGIVQAYVAAIRMLHPHGGTEDASSSPPPLRPPHPPPHFGGDGSGSDQHDHVIPQLDLLRPFLGGAPSPSAPSPFPHNLGRLLAESSFINTAPVVDAFGAGTSSGGPVRRQASSSRSSPPVQPRQQHRRRRESGERMTIMVPVQRTGNTDLPPDDGYTWRKYGQKDILGSRFPRFEMGECKKRGCTDIGFIDPHVVFKDPKPQPTWYSETVANIKMFLEKQHDKKVILFPYNFRSYYRCTHKNYYGCEAKKKVQRLDDDPFTYEVTYCGNHTCLTSTTPLLTLPAGPATAASTAANMLTNSPTGSATVHAAGQDLFMAAAEHPAPALSTAIQLGISWMPSTLVGSSAAEGSSAQVNVNVPASGRDTAEYPVMDLADAMFNSGSGGGSSMDAIFPAHHDRRDT